MRYRKRPIIVDAVQWTPETTQELIEFAGSSFDVLTPQEQRDCDDPEATAQVYDVLHSTWILVYTGDWIIKGIKGEFYPCREDVFLATYERESTPEPEPADQYPHMEILRRRHVELLAFHYTGASDNCGALRCWLREGELTMWPADAHPTIWNGHSHVPIYPGYRLIRLHDEITVKSPRAVELLHVVSPLTH